MKPAVARNSLFAVLGLLVGCLIPSGIARCEIGANINPDAPIQLALIHQFGIIGDDPVPFGIVWRVQSLGVVGRVILNPSGEANGDGVPSILVDPASGLIAVAWAKNSPTGFDVVVSRFQGGAWTTPQVVAGDPGLSEKDPNLVLGPDGTIHVFYWVDGATPQVFYRSAPSDLSAWSSPTLVSQPGQPACRPAGAFFGTTLRVAYEVHDFGYGNTPRQVVLARQDGSGFTPEVVAITSNMGDVFPQVHSHSGRMWVDWIDAEANGAGEVAWTGLDAQGHWEPLQYEPFANVEQRDYFVRGAVRMKAIQ